MTPAAPRRPRGDPWWQNARIRGLIFQAMAILMVLGLGWFLVDNTLANIEQRGIRTGYGYLDQPAGFRIAESPISFDEREDTYGRAVLVGVLNTLQVSLLSIVLATLIGTVLGLARLSPNWLLRQLAGVYVEVQRNVPLLLQLFFWYSFVLKILPAVRDALNPLPNVYLSQRGLFMPVPVDHPAHDWMLLGLLAGIVGAVFIGRWAERRQAETGQRPPDLALQGLAVVGGPALVWLLFGAPVQLDMPALRGFNFQGGMTVTPEFLALLLGLTLYHSAFIAEIVRGGVLAIAKGQWEAATALGLGRSLMMRLIILPQALRVIVPPMTSIYLNITKNSSLAVAIGYPDLVYVTNTTINQAGRAIEAISIMMAIYLTISLAISLVMNWYNARVALTER